ncbi:hypothetical protein BKP64_15755 [Marinobacter salinus]|uniref:DUF3581 domain-containing protein n=1 Tax=Marinobacter salinus TaxID=1874317 RepID=A0A1D9GPE0_9GAMM|nr:DUF3581 domain-containing protein [Marinobacter salinus]AOY89506.1 hypothetical protein BKP64_15755 [Marinobacter salinus]
MFLDRFYSIQDGCVYITAHQASRFAKEIAGDFNPIHDPEARRFCVPGDLLFAVILSRFGLSENMTFKFRSLLGDGVPLEFQESEDGTIEVCDQAGKVYLEVSRSGEKTLDEKAIEDFTRSYVAASGKNFPHTLKPLMESRGVMFNPDRPMVMYESMSLALDSLDIPSSELELHKADLEPAGKRGNVTLEYRLMTDGKPVGDVAKRLILGSLRPYCPDAMAGVIEEFYRLKARGLQVGSDTSDS